MVAYLICSAGRTHFARTKIMLLREFTQLNSYVNNLESHNYYWCVVHYHKKHSPIHPGLFHKIVSLQVDLELLIIVENLPLALNNLDVQIPFKLESLQIISVIKEVIKISQTQRQGQIISSNSNPFWAHGALALFSSNTGHL